MSSTTRVAKRINLGWSFVEQSLEGLTVQTGATITNSGTIRWQVDWVELSYVREKENAVINFVRMRYPRAEFVK